MSDKRRLEELVPHLSTTGEDPIPASVVRECEPLRIPFDRRPFLDALDVGRRKRIYLDLSYWLKLTDQPSATWKDLLGALLGGVAAGRLICPVTPAHLLELAKLRDETQAKQCMDLISNLSRHVMFRDHGARIRDEIAYAVRNSHSPPALSAHPWWFAFSMYPDMYGDMVLVSHPSPEGREVLEKLAPHLFRETVEKGLRHRYAGEFGYPEALKRAEETYEKSMAAFRARAPRGKVRFEEQFEVEASDLIGRLAGRYLNIAASAGGNEIAARFMARYRTDAARRKYQLEHVPTLRVEAEVLAAWAESGAKYERNDYFDIENLVTATPYVHFLTGDRMMTHIARRLKWDRTFGLRIIDSPESLLEAIGTLA